MTAPQTTAPSGKMPRHRIFAYSLGDVANNLSFMMTSMFLMVYMTEIAGISATVAGTIYAVTKIWAGFSDLIAGQTVDRFDTRWGRLRPWILFGSTPLAITFVLLFSVPAGLSPGLTIAWILLLDAAFQLAYSFVNIPYGSLSAAMTQDPVDRSKLSGARSIASAITGVALSAIIAPQFDKEKIATVGSENIRVQLTLTMLALGVLAIILYFICFKNSREVVPRGQGKVSITATLKMVIKNRPLLNLCLGALFLLGAMFTMNAVGMYYAINILGNGAQFTMLMAAQTVGTVIVSSLVPSLTVYLGKRWGYVFSAGIAILGYIVIFFSPEQSLVTALIAWFLLGAGTGGSNSLMFSMQADTVDYGEWKTGIRAEGGSYSILSFIRKVGQGIGGGLAGVILAYFGYSEGAATQTAEALDGIRWACGLVPAILALGAALIMIAYPLTSSQHSKIVSELNERRTQDTVSNTKGVSRKQVVAGLDGADGRSTRIRRIDSGHPPIITLFGQRGSAASEIGPMLAERLGVPYIGQRFTSTELAQADSSALISDNAFARWMRSMAYSGSQETDLAAASDLSANRSIAQENTEYVIGAVENGGVILGRNAPLILGHVVGVMNVRVIAPLSTRVERVMETMELDANEAENQCHAEDRIRSEMAHALYQWDPNSDEYYDLVINTGWMPWEKVVDIIADAYRKKYPENFRG